MSESTTETPEAAKPSRSFSANVEAPKDAPEESAVGYAVFNTTLGQFAGPVHRDGKPSAEDARGFIPKGHKHKIVRV